MVRAGGARRSVASHDADFILYRKDGCAPQLEAGSAVLTSSLLLLLWHLRLGST